MITDAFQRYCAHCAEAICNHCGRHVKMVWIVERHWWNRLPTESYVEWAKRCGGIK